MRCGENDNVYRGDDCSSGGNGKNGDEGVVLCFVGDECFDDDAGDDDVDGSGGGNSCDVVVVLVRVVVCSRG